MQNVMVALKRFFVMIITTSTIFNENELVDFTVNFIFDTEIIIRSQIYDALYELKWFAVNSGCMLL